MKMKIEEKHDVCDTCDEKASCVNPCPTKLIEGQKPDWSEEDEKCLENAIMYCEWARDKAPDLYCYETSEKSINFLKSFKGRVQPKHEWSEEDNAMLISIENILIGRGHSFHDKEINWLKSLRPQPKQSLDEDTQQWIDTIIKDYEDLYDADKDHRATIQAKINILKSLRPQNRWKPTEWQMKSLKEACDEHWEPDGLDPLYTLYQDLKKLMEK